MEKFIVIDTETTNSLDDPIVYDVGFAVVDAEGTVYEKHSYVVADIFLDKELMSYAYFADKIPQYLDDMRKGTRQIVNTWQLYKIVRELTREYDIKAFIAHNARFDVRVLNSTLRYQTKSKRRFFFPYGIPIWDTMAMANDTICKQSNYQRFCMEHGYMTNHKTPQVRKTAEILWRFLTNDNEFEESHTGLEDVAIEAQIFAECVRRHKKMARLAELDEE